MNAPLLQSHAVAIENLLTAARAFAREFSISPHNALRGVDNGKAVGTYIEHALREYLVSRNVIRATDVGNSASGIDLISLDTDIKFTSVRQPQSSSPFRSFKQKIEGIGHNLLIFVYEKRDTPTQCFLPLRSVRFIYKERTADYQTTRGILEIIARNGNADDIFAFLVERMIPTDEHTLSEYARHLLTQPPLQGYLTISNALQWRLQYGRVIAGDLEGVIVLDPDDALVDEANDSIIIRQPNDSDVLLKAESIVSVENFDGER